MSTNRQKLSQWTHLFKIHKRCSQTELYLTQQQNKNSSSKFYLFEIENITNLKLPQQNEVLPPHIKYSYSIQLNMTLYNQTIGFFGRTYRGKHIPIKQNQQSQEMSLSSTEWAMLHTQHTSLETKVIVEIVAIQTDQNKTKKLFCLGFAILPIFFEENPKSVEIYQGTPRNLMYSTDSNQTFQKTGSLLNFQVKKEQNQFQKLLPLIPDNCLFGVNDEIPGISGSKLTQLINEVETKCEISKFSTLYAHNIRISSMNEVESTFEAYLQQVTYEQTNLEILERKLSVVPHNSWQQIGTQSFVSLNKQYNGMIQSSGALKIINFLMHPMIALIFQLEYRGTLYLFNETHLVKLFQKEGKVEIKDFVLGWCAHIPSLTGMNEDIKDEEVQLDIILGPGTSLLGDVLWDQTVVRQKKQLFIKMAVMLTGSEDVVSNQQRFQRQNEQEIQDKAIQQRLQNEDYQRLLQIQQENENLRKEKEELEKLKEKPNELIINQTLENQEIKNAKEYYLNKNDEIEQLIQQVLKSEKEGKETSLPQSIIDQGEQSVASLLRFLIQIVMQNYGPTEENMKQNVRQEMTKKNLLEMLKGDQNYKMNIFGTQGGMTLLQSRELSRQDKINLIRLGIGKNLLDPETEAKLIQSEPRMDVEVADPYKASTITFKFVAFKTGLYLNKDIQIPERIYFTFKFFTFKSVETEKLLLKQPSDVQNQQINNQSQLHTAKRIKPDTQYYLVKLSTLQQAIGQDLDQAALEQGFKIIFDIDPSISQVEDENLFLSRYLKDRVLTIDLWNGDSLMHFATCKVPLHQIMRQGEPSKVIGQEYDVCEAEFGQLVGGLQILMTNEGRRIDLDDQSIDKKRTQPSQSKQKHKKKVLSKAIDSISKNYEGSLASLAQQYETEKSNLTQTFQSEEARKRLRVERLKKQAVFSSQTVLDFNNPSVQDWQKIQTLKQLELVRESKKSQLLNQVMKETMQCQQKINVTPGQINLINFLVQNPFAQDDVFDIIISDPDQELLPKAELNLVHNEIQEWQYWFNEGKCQKPSDWDIVSSKNKIILSSGQQCPLLFKFLSYREPIFEAQQMYEKAKASPNELRPRRIKISVLSKERMPIGSMELQIVPREPICDQTFRFYEAQNTQAYIKIPQFVPFSLQGMHIVSSNNEITANIDQNNEAYIVLQTNRAPFSSYSYIYIYQDQFCSQLLGCCKVEIYALACVSYQLKTGVENVKELQVKSQIQRTVEIFSSDKRLVYPPGDKDRNVQRIQPNEFKNIQIAIRPIRQGNQRARVHCVDINTKELVQSWLLEIQSDKPQLAKAYQIDLKVGRHTPYKFEFKNSLSVEGSFEFFSNNPTIMHIRKEKEILKAHEKKELELYFPPQSRVGQFEVILYINEKQSNYSESMLFKVLVNE